MLASYIECLLKGGVRRLLAASDMEGTLQGSRSRVVVVLNDSVVVNRRSLSMQISLDGW